MDQTQTAGEPHGKTTPWRWDTSTATAVIVLGALAYLVLVAHTFQVSGTVRAGRS